MSAASLETIHGECWAEGFRRERRVSVSEWSDKYRRLSSVSSRIAGPWHTSRTPYLREIMDCLSPTSKVERVAIMKGGQIGGTECLNNYLGFNIHKNPGPMLMVLPTVDVARKISKQRLRPMFDATPVLRRRVTERKGEKGTKSTLQVMEFDGGLLMLTGANSAAGLSSMPIRDLLCDEIDRFPGDVDGEGDPIALAEERTATFSGVRKVVLVSTPTVRGLSRIEIEYLASDQRRYCVPCPKCGTFDYLTWTGRDWLTREEGGGSHHWIEFDEGKPESARMVCSNPDCAARIEERHKTAMLRDGRWVAQKKGDGTAGFHLSALYSPVGWRSWSRIASQFLKAKGNPTLYKAWVNMALGETFEERGDSVEPEILRERASRETIQRRVVPSNVGALVCSADVQGDRIEAVIKGYGVGEESWLLDFRVLPGDPAEDKVWFDLDAFRRQVLRHENGRRLRVDITVIDSGGLSTEEVYRYCKTRRREHVFAVKGTPLTGLPLVGRPSKSNSYRATLFPLCVDAGKETVMARLLIREPGPGFFHFPPWIDDDYLEQLTAEKAIRKYKPGRGVIREWKKVKARNEALDLEVYALAGLRILGEQLSDRIAERAARWAKPVEVPKEPKREEPTLRDPGDALPRRRRSSWVNKWRE